MPLRILKAASCKSQRVEKAVGGPQSSGEGRCPSPSRAERDKERQHEPMTNIGHHQITSVTSLFLEKAFAMVDKVLSLTLRLFLSCPRLFR